MVPVYVYQRKRAVTKIDGDGVGFRRGVGGEGGAKKGKLRTRSLGEREGNRSVWGKRVFTYGRGQGNERGLKRGVNRQIVARYYLQTQKTAVLSTNNRMRRYRGPDKRRRYRCDERTIRARGGVKGEIRKSLSKRKRCHRDNKEETNGTEKKSAPPILPWS